MKTYLGVLVGLYGYLIPSTITLSFIELKRINNNNRYTLFFINAILMEFIYSFLILNFIYFLKELSWIDMIVKFTIIVLCFGMFIWTCIEIKMIKPKSSPYKDAESIIRRGYFWSYCHPQQFGYYIIVGELFVQEKWLSLSINSITAFCIFTCLGSALAFLLYSFVGKKIVDMFSINSAITNKIIAISYLLTAIWVLYVFIL
ncbi:MAG: hypothetical protein QM539_01145 [Alphaproteobacteria bacterium]|nr:hypothetical protein [Alphaproteobacteria bacterium]